MFLQGTQRTVWLHKSRDVPCSVWLAVCLMLNLQSYKALLFVHAAQTIRDKAHLTQELKCCSLNEFLWSSKATICCTLGDQQLTSSVSVNFETDNVKKSHKLKADDPHLYYYSIIIHFALWHSWSVCCNLFFYFKISSFFVLQNQSDCMTQHPTIIVHRATKSNV